MMGKHVVVAPLDWGLGHATRCIPVIQELLSKGCSVTIATSGSARMLLSKEFASVNFFELPPYHATYTKTLPLMVGIFFQLPKFLKAIRQEHNALEKFVMENETHLIISDNRFGCWSARVPSVFITHQLRIQMPGLLQWIEPIVNYFNHRYIKRFARCWVPDISGEFNFTGLLSKARGINPAYIGFLSRFKSGHEVTNGPLVILLSGPEPQRSVLEEKLTRQLHQFSQPVIMVGGVVAGEVQWSESGNLKRVNYLVTKELERILQEASLVISRSGYSTIMDLTRLRKKAILIPTPGQTEQEYLAGRLMHMRICFSMSQNEFNLPEAISHSQGYSGFVNIEAAGRLSLAIDEALQL